MNFSLTGYRGRHIEALKTVLRNAPLGSKNQQIKVLQIHV